MKAACLKRDGCVPALRHFSIAPSCQARPCFATCCSLAFLCEPENWPAAQAEFRARDRTPRASGSSGAPLSGAFSDGANSTGFRRSFRRLRFLPAGARIAGDFAQQLARRRTEDRVHEKSPGGLREPCRALPAARGKAEWNGGVVRLYRDGQIAQPGGTSDALRSGDLPARRRGRATWCAASAKCAKSSTGITAASRSNSCARKSRHLRASQNCSMRLWRTKTSCCTCCGKCRIG